MTPAPRQTSIVSKKEDDTCCRKNMSPIASNFDDDDDDNDDNKVSSRREEDNDGDGINVLLFDLDGTLYDNACGYEQAVHQNIFQFMVVTTDIDIDSNRFNAITTTKEAERIWKPIYEKYNLTKRGLIGEGYVFDSQHYDTFVRNGAEKYFVTKDNELRLLLQSFPSSMKKIIFTNAPESSAYEILKLLGVYDLFDFDHILGTDFLDGGSICKPELKAFTKVMNYLHIPPSDYHRVCYFEDSITNLKAGQQLGFKTVFITSESATLLENKDKCKNECVEEQADQFDAILHHKINMRQLRSQLPVLWKK